MSQTLVLLTGFTGAKLERLTAPFLPHAVVRVAATRQQLDEIPLDGNMALLSFGTGIILSADFLKRLRRPAYNLHAASPDFPGRDPHHHAIYRGAGTYGATLHIMSPKVDAGPIVALKTFQVSPNTTPLTLLAAANEAGLLLIEQLGPALLAAEPLPALPNAKWGPIKTTRSDFKRFCELTPLIDEAELEQRYRAFDGESHDNLTVSLHGRKFRIDKRALDQPRNEAFGNFTEGAFRNLLQQLKSNGYRFARYGEFASDRHVIWRHDVDCSMHRAARLAAIEAEEGVVATYFVNPRSTFYNPFEPTIEKLVRRFQSLGHEIALHFDASAYGATQWTLESLGRAICQERSLLELLLDAPVRAVSWHNPELTNLAAFDAEEIGGLVNAYSARLKHEYTYCSDSNGYWRFKPMAEVIAEGHERLHLLTHPEWWTPEPMAPSDRIDRAILGRARKVRSDYDSLLKRSGRRNITNGDGEER